LKSATATGGSSGLIPNYSETYQYNPIGNLTQRNGQNYTYPTTPGSARPHAVTAVGANTYQYDPNGNMQTRQESGITYTQSWNPENRLKQVTWLVSGQKYTSTFVYDGDSNRVLEIEEKPVPPPAQSPVETTTGSTTQDILTTKYYTHGGQRVAMRQGTVVYTYTVTISVPSP
jgi:YD repeat-containing protein